MVQVGKSNLLHILTGPTYLQTITFDGPALHCRMLKAPPVNPRA